jgi:hypothetical protein
MKATFVQIEEKKQGVKVTAWQQEFSYSESCHNVYLHKSIYRNGAKSTVPTFAKVTNQEVPEILTANVYFWHPGANAAWRRSNEKNRNSELADFMRDNKKEAEEKLNEMFAKHLIRGEKICVDRLGAYLSYRNNDYHFDGIINKRSIEMVREAIKERRLSDVRSYREQKLKKDQFNALLPKTFVTIEDSISAGNCPAGTLNFYNNLSLVKKGFHLRALRADALLQLRDDRYTRRAVSKAIEKSLN